MHMIRAVREIATHVSENEPPFVEFRRLHQAGHSAPKPPIFLLGDTNPLVTNELFGQIKTPQIGCYVLEDASVGPTGIALKGETAFCSAAFIHPPHHVVAVVDRLNASKLPTRHVPGPLAVIYGPAHETHGHWLVDFMPRLAVLYYTGHDLASLRFLVPPDLSPSATESLRLCGITDQQLVRYAHWQEIIHTDLLLMPTGPRLGDRLSPYFAAATRFWLRRIRARFPAPRPTPGLRLFVSRSNAPQQRRLQNRQEIEDIATRHGMTIIQPDQLPLLDQFALFESAVSIVGEYGSALHNSVFSASGTIICGLRGTSRHPSFVQSGIATALNQQAGYVFGKSDGQNVTQRFKISPAAFERALELISLHAPDMPTSLM